MTAQVRLTKLNKGITPGTPVPSTTHHPGLVGIWAEEQLMDSGYDLNQGKGADMPDLGCEVKTRAMEAHSPITLGACSLQEIIKTPYDESHIKSKTQSIYKVTHSSVFKEVVKDEIVDFSCEDCQEILRDGYENIREQLLNVGDKKYVRGNKHVIAEIQDNGTWQIRVTDRGFKTLEAIAGQQKSLKELLG